MHTAIGLSACRSESIPPSFSQSTQVLVRLCVHLGSRSCSHRQMRQPLRSPASGRSRCPIAAKGRSGGAAIGPCAQPGAACWAERDYITSGGHACRGIARGTPPPPPTQQPCPPAQPHRYVGRGWGWADAGREGAEPGPRAGRPGRPRGASPPPPTAGAASCLRPGPRARSAAPTALWGPRWASRDCLARELHAHFPARAGSPG